MTGPQTQLSISRRTRRTPYSRRVEAAGVSAYTVYNHMLLPTVFHSLEEDYRHLKRHVQLWDVACQRQVEVRGRDAAGLMQMLTPRDLGPLRVGQCCYTPVVDDAGGMLNDPVALKLAEDRFWLSIADSDLLLWVKGLALGLGLQATVEEPDVAPLAVQGPLAEELVARVFGDAIRGIGFFRCRPVPFRGRELLVARSGYSRQGGFELYLQGAESGEALWDSLWQAGADLQVRAGAPNLIERIEAGLLSYGNDMTRQDTPYQCGLERYCNPERAIGCIGRSALLRALAEGPGRQIRGLRIAGAPLAPCREAWPLRDGGLRVGQVTSAAWSPDHRANLAIGMVRASHWTPGTGLEVDTAAGPRAAVVAALPFPAGPAAKR